MGEGGVVRIQMILSHRKRKRIEYCTTKDLCVGQTNNKQTDGSTK